MKKRITALVLSLALCLGLSVTASAATRTETFDYFGEVWEIPNVTKVSKAAWIGGYYDEETDTSYYYDPEGWTGYIFNDTVGYPVYYVSGDSVTLTRTGDTLGEHNFTAYKSDGTGSFAFNAEMSDMFFDTYPAVGTGYEKFSYDNSTEWATIPSGASTVTLGKGVWTGPGVQDFTAFLIVVGGEDSSEQVPPAVSFTDVKPGDWFADPVQWAVENEITAGTSAATFSPGQTCTRGQIITFLWKAAGAPEPKAAANGFSDVKDDDYFNRPTQWAKERGMAAGDAFAPGEPCTRAMAVEFMWKLDGAPKMKPADNFTDVSANDSYAQAVAWALDKGVTAGTSATTFAPDMTCTRAQIVTMLYAAFGK